MADYYKLNTRGLNYLTSSIDSSAIRRFLFYILVLSSKQSISIKHLLSWNGRSKEVVSRLVEKMLELNWLQRIDKDEYKVDQLEQNLLLNDFSVLSSTGQVILADVNGLVIFNQGFEQEKSQSIAATASRMASINEVSRQRNLDLYTGHTWSVSMHWGSMHLRTQYICLGSMKFVLVLGGKPQLDKPEFLTLLSTLVRRYAHEQ